MKLLLVNFQNTLDLNGSMNYTNNPMLLYGENIAGKSNIINMLRYCLVPKSARKRKYSEEKRLIRDEILLRENTPGFTEIYFEQANKLYNLIYKFSRRKGKVSQAIRLLEAAGKKPANIDPKLLENLNWNETGVKSHSALKEKFTDLDIYSDILDVLISPSNIRNFVDAISGSLVTVPDIIEKRISVIHRNSERYLQNLKKLQGTITVKKDELNKKFERIKKELAEKTEDLEIIDISSIFVKGKIAENLSKLHKDLKKELDKLPEQLQKIRESITKMKSKEYELKLKALKLVDKSLKEENIIKTRFKQQKELGEREETLKEWKIAFNQLPPITRFDEVKTFKLPSSRKFDFSKLSSPQIKEIFTLLVKARRLVKSAEGTCKKYKTLPKTSELNSKINSYKELLKALKKPSERSTGDPAIIFEEKGKSLVSIPLGVAVKKPEYFKGVEQILKIHKPKKWEEKKFGKEILTCQKRVTSIIDDLKGAKEKLSKAKKAFRRAKNYLSKIDAEQEFIKKEKNGISEYLQKALDEMRDGYKLFCDVMGFKLIEIDFADTKNVSSALTTLRENFPKAQKTFLKETLEMLKDYPEIWEKYKRKGIEDIDVVKQMSTDLKIEEEKLTQRSEKYSNLLEWIGQNIGEIGKVESTKLTIEIIETSSLIAYEFISRIKELSDLNKIIDEVSKTIQENVMDCYRKIFADETFKFEYLGEGQFLSTVNSKPITHPSGSQKAVISLGIMISLSKLFNLPIILDEALDRIDVIRLKSFIEYITALCTSGDYQACLVAYKSFNIEKNPEIVPILAQKWDVYTVKREAGKKVISFRKSLLESQI